MRGGWVVLGLLAYVAPVLAQQTQSASNARFQVSGYAVEGRVLLKSEDFTRVVSPYVGRGKTAADIESARLALLDTYHNLGYCTVRVALAHPGPIDGMVTFRVSEVPAGEVRDCLPALVLDEPARPVPAASAAAAAPAAATTYSYADPRDTGAPALKPRAAVPAPTLAAAPRSETIARRPSPAVRAVPARPGPPASSAPAAAPAPEGVQTAAAPGVAVAPYVEGAGARGLSVANEPPAQGPPRSVEPAVSQVLAEAKNPTDGRSPFVGAAGLAAEPQTASTAPRATAQPVVAVAQAEPVRPALPEPTAAVEAGPSVVAQAEPPKPAPPAKAAPAAPPAPAVPGAPKFEITRYDVEGNTLLRPEVVDRALAPFSGPGRDFGDVQRALEALQLAYQNEGWGGVEIRLPEQELDKGVVRLRVVEPKIAKINVEGNEHFSEANVRRSVPALREGVTPNSREIGKGIRLANENPSKQSAVVLRASEREDHLDATIRVADVDPKRFSISLDNTGNVETQRERLGMAFQHSNMFGRDHVMTLQFITAPKNYNDVLVFGLGYRIPIYSLGDSVDFVAGYSNVDSGTVQDLFVVAGAGTVFAARYNQNLPRWGDLEHRITYGLDYRAYQNDVTPVGGTFKLVPDITVHPLSVTYSGAWRAEGKGELSYYLSLVQNIPGGNDGQDEDFKQVGARFPDGTAGYRLFRTGASYSRPVFGDWQVRVRADGQYTDDALVSGEMFAIGGADSVRGVNERYVSNDKGYRTSWEIYTPDMAKGLGLDGRLRFLAFYDQGLLRRNKVQPGELEQQSLDSTGFGLRMNYRNNLTLRFDVAFLLHDGTTPLNVNGKDGQTKAHFAMAWVW